MISIIIPVYDVEHYLATCIDSILLQSYISFELLLINDGSTDKSLSICLNYEKLDSRIKVVNKVNGGVSSARNNGIAIASGEWITFIDSDDKIDVNYLQDLILSLEQDFEVDFVFHGLKRVKDGAQISETNIPDLVVKYNDYNILFNKCQISLNGNPVSKLFKKSIIDEYDLSFNLNFTYNEDKIFILEYVLKCKNFIVFSSAKNYLYNINSGSLTNKLLQPHDYLKPYKHFKYLAITQYGIRFSDDNYSIIYTNFKIYLHMYVNSVFVHKRNQEHTFLSLLDDEDWNLYKHISRFDSSIGRKIFDFFLLKKFLFFPRILAKKFIAPNFR